MAGTSPLALERRGVVSSEAVRERLAYADGLRAIAVGGVALFFVVALAPALFGGAAAPLARTLAEGAHGVELFFVLSGLCLAYPVLMVLRNEQRVAFDGARYAARRITRILPPYYLAIGLLVLVPLVASRLGHPIGPIGNAVKPTDLVRQIFFLDGGTKFLNPAFWTLCVTVRWYALFPFALALWIKSPRAFGIVTMVVIIGPLFTTDRGLDVGFLPAFLLGIIAADLRVQPLRFQRLTAILIPFLVAAAAVTETSPSLHVSYVVPLGAHLVFRTSVLWQLAAFVAIVAAGEVRFVERVLSLRAFAAIAAVSYSIFLLFAPVLAAVYH